MRLAGLRPAGLRPIGMRPVGMRLAATAPAVRIGVVDEIGSRAQILPAPPHVVWRSLTAPDEPGTRAWLAPGLLADEVVPTVLESDEPTRVVWSTL